VRTTRHCSRSPCSSRSTRWTCRPPLKLGPTFQKARKRDGLRAVAIAASTGEGIPAFRAAIAELLPSIDEALAAQPEPSGVVVHRLDAAPDRVTIRHESEGVYRVIGRRIERLASQTNFEVEESADRFQRALARLGADAELRRAGIKPGDLVLIGAVELEWEAEPWAVRR
jgi:GTP-binding protein